MGNKQTYGKQDCVYTCIMQKVEHHRWHNAKGMHPVDFTAHWFPAEPTAECSHGLPGLNMMCDYSTQHKTPTFLVLGIS